MLLLMERTNASALTNSVYTMAAPVAFAQQSEPYVGHVFHRREEQRMFSKLYITDFHLLTPFLPVLII
jgi:hypothetical protein